MTYFNKTVEEVRKSMMNRIETGNLDRTRGGWLDNIISAAASEITSLYNGLDTLIAQDDPELMDADTLLLRARAIGIYHYTPLPAKYRASVENTEGIEENMRVTVASVQFVISGVGTGTFVIQAVTPGKEANGVETGTEFSIAGKTATITEAVQYGREDETLDELRERYKSALMVRPIAANPVYFKSEAESIAGVSHAKVVRPLNAALSVKYVAIYLADDKWEPVSDDIVTQCSNYIQTVLPIGGDAAVEKCTNTSAYKWYVNVTNNTNTRVNADDISGRVRTHMQDFAQAFNSGIAVGTIPVFETSQMEGYVINQMYPIVSRIDIRYLSPGTSNKMNSLTLIDGMFLKINSENVTVTTDNPSTVQKRGKRKP